MGLIPPSWRRLFVAGSVCWIVCGFDLREPLHAGGMDLGDPVPDGRAVGIFLVLRIAQNSFKSDHLPLLESLGELREIGPGEDAMPFGAGLVVSLVVLPALLGGEVEGDVLLVVGGCLDLCILSEAADEDDGVEHGV